MNEWHKQARRSTLYMAFGGGAVAVGSTLVLSQLVANATAVGFGLAFAGVPLLLLAYREIPSLRK